MITMAYRINRFVSVYEFDETGRRGKHRILKDPAPEMLRGIILLDLWDIRNSASANKKTLLEHSKMYENMWSEELGVTMGAGFPLDQDVPMYEFLGRLWTFDRLVRDPKALQDVPERYLDDVGFMVHMGEKLYPDMKSLYDETFSTDRT